MLKAINHHGISVYRDVYQPIDDKNILSLMRVAYESMQVMVHAMSSGVEDIQKTPAEIFNVRALARSGVLDIEAVKKNIASTFNSYPPIQKASEGLVTLWEEHKLRHPDSKNKKPITMFSNPARLSDFYIAHVKAVAELTDLGINYETIAYGMEQMADMRSQARGRLQGVAFAHEGFADDMMFATFCLMYSSLDKYPGNSTKEKEAEFDKIYPYFSSHGHYKEIYKGEQTTGVGLEEQHAIRELEKIRELPSYEREAALEGAAAFADRQAKVWDGMLQSQELIRQTPEMQELIDRALAVTKLISGRAASMPRSFQNQASKMEKLTSSMSELTQKIHRELNREKFREGDSRTHGNNR